MYYKHEVELIDSVYLNGLEVYYYGCRTCFKIFCWFRQEYEPKGHPCGRWDLL